MSAATLTDAQEQIRREYAARQASERAQAHAAIAQARSLGHTFNEEWIATWFTTASYLWMARCQTCKACVICRSDRVPQAEPFAHGDALMTHCSGVENVPGAPVTPLPSEDDPWALAEALAAQHGHLLRGWCRVHGGSREGDNYCTECDASLHAVAYKPVDDATTPHQARVRKIDGRALTHRCAGSDGGGKLRTVHLLRAPVQPDAPAVAAPQKPRVANPLYLNLPRIVRFLGTDDAGEDRTAKCPHCGAKGRYIHHFITEDGRQRGAMAHCFRQFPIHPFAKIAADLEEKERKVRQSSRALARWDQRVLEALDAYYAGSMCEDGVYDAINRARAAKRAWMQRRGYRS